MSAFSNQRCHPLMAIWKKCQFKTLPLWLNCSGPMGAVLHFCCTNLSAWGVDSTQIDSTQTVDAHKNTSCIVNISLFAQWYLDSPWWELQCYSLLTDAKVCGPGAVCVCFLPLDIMYEALLRHCCVKTVNASCEWGSMWASCTFTANSQS